VPGSIVRWNGSDRATTYVSASELQAAVGVSDIASQGTALVTVFNPMPGGGVSEALTFTITPPDNPVPVASMLSPASAMAGGPAFTLTVTGSSFVAGSVVRWSGSDRVTTYVSATELRADIAAADIAGQGTALVRVFNPTPGGGLSEALTFTIAPPDNPLPVASMLSPASATAGGPAFALTVTGSGFVPSSTVRWNGSDRSTTYVSPTELQAAIGPGDIASQGTALVTVFNPTPGGGTSEALTFTIDAAPGGGAFPTVAATSIGTLSATTSHAVTLP
jgi:hypothetical protein